MKSRPYEPVLMELIDGREVRLALGFGGLQRVFQRFNTEDLGEIMKLNLMTAAPPVLYEALPREWRERTTPEEFIELVPGHPEYIARVFAKLIGVSLPEPDGSPPPVGGPASEAQPSTGPPSGDSGLLGSDSPTPNSGN